MGGRKAVTYTLTKDYDYIIAFGMTAQSEFKATINGGINTGTSVINQSARVDQGSGCCYCKMNKDCKKGGTVTLGGSYDGELYIFGIS